MSSRFIENNKSQNGCYLVIILNIIKYKHANMLAFGAAAGPLDLHVLSILYIKMDV